MTKPGDRAYKRSWKNLLINKRYQLRFTLFMVGIAGLLMAGLGIWIKIVADETTKVSKTSKRGEPCPKIPVIEAPYEELPPPTMKLPDAPPPIDAGSAAADARTGDRPRRPKIDVTLDAMELPKPILIVPPIPVTFKGDVVDHWTCELLNAAAIERLDAGHLRIMLVLVGSMLLLTVGLAVFGIKMTHKVAGPLFKVQLYLAKMKEGRLDKVYNLRKGDQLVEFYDHFKHAHAGIVALEKSDIDRLKAVIAAAEAAGAGEHASIAELRAMLARKEKSVE